MFDILGWDVGLAAGENDQTATNTATDTDTDTDTDTGLPVDPGRHVLPDDVETMAPGNFLAAVLSVVDPCRLSGRDLVRYVQAQERLVSHYQAAFYQGIAELAHAVDADTLRRDPIPHEFASDELQAALSKTRRSADTDLALALDLQTRLPRVWEALSQGHIDIRRARVFARETTTLNPNLIPRIVEPLLAEASELTTGQLGSRLAKRVIEADPTTAEHHYQTGLQDRKLVVYPNPDHTASIGMFSVDPVEAVAATNHVHELALKLKRLPGETRTLDQLRADIALDLLQGKTTNTPETTNPPQAEITVTVTGDDPTGHIPGYGPVLISQHHNPTANITMAATPTTPPGTTDIPSNGECHQTTSRKPTKAQVEHIQQTYPTCIYPGCRMPATRCDLDHRHPWHKGGKTTCTNLAPLCRHHHRCKDEGGWKLRRNPNGSHTWTSPLGHTYTTRAPP